MSYKLMRDGMVMRLADGTFLPTDPLNRDYQRYLAWIEEGNTPEPADPEPIPPPKIEVGDDVPADQEKRLANAVDNLRTFLANPTPTNAAILAALKVTIRLMLFLLKRQGY